MTARNDVRNESISSHECISQSSVGRRRDVNAESDAKRHLADAEVHRSVHRGRPAEIFGSSTGDIVWRSSVNIA